MWTDEIGVLPRTIATAFEDVAYHVCTGLPWAFLVAAREPLVFDDDAARYPAKITEAMAAVDCPRTEGRDEILRRTAGLGVNTTYRPLTEYYLR